MTPAMVVGSVSTRRALPASSRASCSLLYSAFVVGKTRAVLFQNRPCCRVRLERREDRIGLERRSGDGGQGNGGGCGAGQGSRSEKDFVILGARQWLPSPLPTPRNLHQMSMVAAASTIPVTNAAKQENSSTSFRILMVIVASPRAHDGFSTFASFDVCARVGGSATVAKR
jgi:hypothetical protein